MQLGAVNLGSTKLAYKLFKLWLVKTKTFEHKNIFLTTNNTSTAFPFCWKKQVEHFRRSNYWHGLLPWISLFAPKKKKGCVSCVHAHLLRASFDTAFCSLFFSPQIIVKEGSFSLKTSCILFRAVLSWYSNARKPDGSTFLPFSCAPSFLLLMSLYWHIMATFFLYSKIKVIPHKRNILKRFYNVW